MNNAKIALSEWQRNKALCFAWPQSQIDWQEELPAAQKEWLQLVISIQEASGGVCVFYKANTSCPVDELKKLGIETVELNDYREIWMRDSSPLYYRHQGQICSLSFQFNSWGSKYPLDGDACFYQAIIEKFQLRNSEEAYVLEGGSVEFNDHGACLTTEECLLNKNRNSLFAKTDYEKSFKENLGVNKIFWIPNGMSFDHTDGHVDNVARFADDKTILINDWETAPEYQQESLKRIDNYLISEAVPLGYKIMKIPCPKNEIIGPDETPCPLSYLNFNLFRDLVIVPSYNEYSEEEIRLIFENIFPSKRVLFLSSKTLIKGGGSIHCLSHQVA